MAYAFIRSISSLDCEVFVLAAGAAEALTGAGADPVVAGAGAAEGSAPVYPS
ncbi:hypothetical protein D3C75_1267940 [compost metagenome]